MADKEFEPDDPFQPVAVALSTPGYDGMEAMARCFVEEFAVMGWPPARIFKLFTIPEFAGTYSVYQERGRDYVRGLIAEVFGESFVDEPDLETILLMPTSQRGAPRTGKEGQGDA